MALQHLTATRKYHRYAKRSNGNGNGNSNSNGNRNCYGNRNHSNKTNLYEQNSICSGWKIYVGNQWYNGQRIWLLLMLFSLIWHLYLIDGVQGYKYPYQQHRQRRQEQSSQSPQQSTQSSQQQQQQQQQQSQSQPQQYDEFIESDITNQMAVTTKTVKKQLGKYLQHLEQLQHPYHEKPNPLEIIQESNTDDNNAKEDIGSEQVMQAQQVQQGKQQQRPQQQHEQQQQQQQIIDDPKALTDRNEIMTNGQRNNLSSSTVSVVNQSKKPPLSQLNDADISDTLKTGLYFFLALSIIAIAVILCKVYSLRLTRAERKYGVQGDRTTQEFKPLQESIDDDINSDDGDNEDHTVYDVQLQHLMATHKYGVHGDRITRKLTPLPISIDDDINSDDDQRTIYDIQLQQLRIF